MYWCKRRIEVTVVGPEGIRHFDSERPFLQIGSLAKSNIVVSGSGIPSRAYFLQATDQGLFCLRLAKECNGVELYQGWVGDEPLILGDYQITAHVAPPVNDMTPQGPPLDAKDGCHPPFPVIAIESDGIRKSAVCVRRSLLLVGRLRPSMLRLVSDSVSSTHLAFFWDGQRLWFVDLFSSNGTKVEGQAREVGCLEPEGAVSLGSIQLRFLGVSANRGEEYLTVEELAQRRLRKQADEYSRRLARLKKESRRRLKANRKVWRSRLLAIKQQVEELTTTLSQTCGVLESERLEWNKQRDELETRLRSKLLESPEAVTLVSAQEHSDYAVSSSAQIALLEQRLNDLEVQRQQERAQDALVLATEHLLLQSETSPWHGDGATALSNRHDLGQPHAAKRLPLAFPSAPISTDGIVIAASPVAPARRSRVARSRPNTNSEPEETMIRVTRRLVTIDAKRRRRLLLIWSCSLAAFVAIAGIGTVLARAYAPRIWNRCVPAALHVEVGQQQQ